MNCQDIHHKSIDYLEGLLSNRESGDFRQHMQSCPACRAYMAFIKEAYALPEQEKQQTANPFMATRVLERLQRRPVSAPLSGSLRWLQHAIAVALLLLGIWFGVQMGTHIQSKQDSHVQMKYTTAYLLDDINQENIPKLLEQQD